MHDQIDGLGVRTDVSRATASIKMPTVAAIVCNFNQKAFLEDSIASMLEQTYPHMEYVVVDDCSTDGSAEVIKDILSRIGNGRVRFLQHEDNRGQMAAMLSGLDATTAPFVAWLDADDIWFPEYIERHVAHHLSPQVNAAISTSNLAVIDAGGTIIAGADPTMSITSPIRKPERSFRKSERSFPMRPTAFRVHGKEVDFYSIEPVGPVFINCQYEPWVWSPTSGMVFRRVAVDAIRPLDCKGLRTSADHYLARFSHVVGGTIWMNETLGCYRIHGSNGFAKRAVCGDRPIGVQPKHITEEGNYQFAVKLQESEILTGLLPRHDLRRLLVQIGRDPRAIREILANKKLRRVMRVKERVRLLNRYVAARFWASSKT